MSMRGEAEVDKTSCVRKYQHAYRGINIDFLESGHDPHFCKAKHQLKFYNFNFQVRKKIISWIELYFVLMTLRYGNGPNAASEFTHSARLLIDDALRCKKSCGYIIKYTQCLYHRHNSSGVGKLFIYKKFWCERARETFSRNTTHVMHGKVCIV